MHNLTDNYGLTDRKLTESENYLQYNGPSIPDTDVSAENDTFNGAISYDVGPSNVSSATSDLYGQQQNLSVLVKNQSLYQQSTSITNGKNPNEIYHLGQSTATVSDNLETKKDALAIPHRRKRRIVAMYRDGLHLSKRSKESSNNKGKPKNFETIPTAAQSTEADEMDASTFISESTTFIPENPTDTVNQTDSGQNEREHVHSNPMNNPATTTSITPDIQGSYGTKESDSYGVSNASSNNKGKAKTFDTIPTAAQSTEADEMEASTFIPESNTFIPENPTDTVNQTDSGENEREHVHSNPMNNPAITTSMTPTVQGVSPLYIDIGDSQYACQYCNAVFWYSERSKKSCEWRNLKYTRCCAGGQVYLEKELDPPMYLKQIFKDKHFLDNVRAYNQMFSMTSFGAQIDDTINDGKESSNNKGKAKTFETIPTSAQSTEADEMEASTFIPESNTFIPENPTDTVNQTDSGQNEREHVHSNPMNNPAITTSITPAVQGTNCMKGLANMV
ncbi:hypothetical protein CTI12_AA194570 [Artemisia annua]|uniref:Uncharacterized protein n=1 Tax=Artemisia annua TaxID=35608 RepID=A0A2U1P4H6_ARTAN|nr:hypothetical protein CTI12_AA194570 [Artemisia annua]